MTGRWRHWLFAVKAGLLVILISLAFGWLPGIEGCGDTGVTGSIVAFELVRSPAEVAALFGGEPCRAVFASAMRDALLLDAFAFIPAYVALLVFPMLALARLGPRIAAAGVAAVGLAALLDEVEGVLLLGILADLPGDPGRIALLVPVVRAKFALLGLTAAAIGWLFARTGSAGRLVGAAITLGGALTVWGIADPARANLLVQGATLSWLCIFLAALAFAVLGFRERRAGA